MNSNWGLIDPLNRRVRDKKEKRRQLADRALTDFLTWMESVDTAPALDPSKLRQIAGPPVEGATP
jgi:hypothetical protein